MSGHTPITKEHLCSIQNKYQTKTSWPRSSLLPALEKYQEKIRKQYVEASETVGQSEDIDKINNTLIRVANRH